MHAAATALVDEQRKTTNAVQASTVSLSNWIAAIALLISAFLAVTGLVIVRGIAARLREAISQLYDGADQVTAAAGQISASSQALAQGASEQAASLQQTSASSEEISSMTQRNAEALVMRINSCRQSVIG